MNKALKLLNALRRFPSDNYVRWGQDDWAKETLRAEGWTVRTRFDDQLDVYYHFDLDGFECTPIQEIGSFIIVESLKSKVEAIKKMYHDYIEKVLDDFYGWPYTEDTILTISTANIFDVDHEQENELIVEFYNEKTRITNQFVCSRSMCFECVKNFVEKNRKE